MRAFGSINYVEAIAKFHAKRFKNIDVETQICTVNGGVEGLYCSILGLVNPGDEVIQFDPSYDCYRPQVQMAGGKTIGIAMKPKQQVFLEKKLSKAKSKFVKGAKMDIFAVLKTTGKSITKPSKKLSMKKPKCSS